MGIKPKKKEATVHKRVGASGLLAADGRRYRQNAAGVPPKLTNKWANVTCKMCLAKKPKAKK